LIDSKLVFLVSKFKKCDQENTEKEKCIFDDEQLVLYPDPQSHDFKNLEIETIVNQANEDLVTSVVVSQTEVASSADTQNLPQIQVKTEQNTNTTGMRIRLKLPDESTTAGIVADKLLAGKRPQIPNDIVIDDDEAILTTTEDDDDRDLTHAALQQSTAKLNRSVSVNKSKKQQQFKSEINVEQLKCGFASKKTIDFNFIQIYLALNKPSQMKFLYEWVPVKDISSSGTSHTITNEDLDKQRFYIDVLSHVAHAFLSEIKINQEFLLENRLSNGTNVQTITTNNSMALNTGNNKKLQLLCVNSHQPTQLAAPKTTSEALQADLAAKEAKKLMDDINKSRKARQRKALVVKTNRSTMQKNLNDFQSDSPPIQSQSNIVLSGPVAAVARKIVNLSSENEKPQQQYHSNNLQMLQNPAVQTQALHQNYSNIMPHILSTFMNDSMNYPSSCSSGSSTSSVQQQQQNNQYMMQVNGDQQSIGLDVSLLDITLNTESVFNLNENSNMSSMSCKSFFITIREANNNFNWVELQSNQTNLTQEKIF
jgi:hypothetical protein